MISVFTEDINTEHSQEWDDTDKACVLCSKHSCGLYPACEVCSAASSPVCYGKLNAFWNRSNIRNYVYREVCVTCCRLFHSFLEGNLTVLHCCRGAKVGSSSSFGSSTTCTGLAGMMGISNRGRGLTGNSLLPCSPRMVRAIERCLWGKVCQKRIRWNVWVWIKAAVRNTHHHG